MRKLTRSRVAYVDDGLALEGYLVTPSRARDLPGVLVAPSWLNVAESTCRRADRLAEEGFVVFVADLLGPGVLPAPPQSPDQVVAPFLAGRLHLRRRLLAGLAALQDRLVRSPDRVAAIGYCLGGIYGGARHAFTGEGIADGESDEAGVDPQAEQRSWEAMLRFLEEVLRPAPANRASEHVARNGQPRD